jgi:hypothetical protein
MHTAKNLGLSVVGAGWLLVLTMALMSCATTRQTGEAGRSGFLGDYSDLREGREGEAQLVYINPETDFRRYRSIMIESVTIWYASEASRLSAEDEQMLADHLYAALHQELSKSFQIVDQPGPAVMKLRAAITEAQGAKVVANAVTTIVPQLRLLATVGGLATGTAALVGEAAVEVDITDSQTGERLAAAVDERVGTKTIRGGLGKWSHVKEAYAFWATRLRERLIELRAR